MPNQVVVASAGIIAVSVAVAAAIAVYESPELRRLADDVRRRIAIALHSLGDNVDPRREPLFNRPEDAEGFLRSRSALGDPGVDADEETRRRQREELMYWNALREEKEKERRDAEKADDIQQSPTRGTTFDDFLQEDKSGERGTYVFNTGADVRPNNDGLVRRRGLEGVRGLNASVYANPFGDENGIDFDEHPGMEIKEHPLAPGRDEIMSDIYNASPRLPESRTVASQTLSPQPAPEVLFDFDDSHAPNEPLQALAPAPVPWPASERSVTLERELAEDEYMTAGQDDRQDAYASIQAWAQNSNPSFYSPLPMSPPAPLSEPEIISDGALTPTDLASVAESGVDLGNEVASSTAGDDVLSEDDDGMATPSSWSDVGSVVSESDGPVHA